MFKCYIESGSPIYSESGSLVTEKDDLKSGDFIRFFKNGDLFKVEQFGISFSVTSGKLSYVLSWDYTWVKGKKVYCWKHASTINLSALDKIVLYGS